MKKGETSKEEVNEEMKGENERYIKIKLNYI